MTTVGVEQSLTENAHYRIEGLRAVCTCTSVPLGLAMDMAWAGRRVVHIFVHLSCLSGAI